MHWFANIFFIFLKDLFYKLCLGCNIGQFLMIFLFKVQLKIWKNYGFKLNSQTFECHWPQSKIFYRLATINGTNIFFQAKKICHGCQCLCHRTVPLMANPGLFFQLFLLNSRRNKLKVFTKLKDFSLNSNFRRFLENNDFHRCLTNVFQSALFETEIKLVKYDGNIN